jgi:hypothetical protein
VIPLQRGVPDTVEKSCSGNCGTRRWRRQSRRTAPRLLTEAADPGKDPAVLRFVSDADANTVRDRWSKRGKGFGAVDQPRVCLPSINRSSGTCPKLVLSTSLRELPPRTGPSMSRLPGEGVAASWMRLAASAASLHQRSRTVFPWEGVIVTTDDILGSQKSRKLRITRSYPSRPALRMRFLLRDSERYCLGSRVGYGRHQRSSATGARGAHRS